MDLVFPRTRRGRAYGDRAHYGYQLSLLASISLDVTLISEHEQIIISKYPERPIDVLPAEIQQIWR